ncbi:hypothetical protein GOP47_0017738 [Adiantum capillus-veneris]|uniref:Core Histone H2A/H2B/H3 domain-containing protein n=1 Tax=Adiantum capillus-veneris TaxID=13818 RepID=A0A9D4ZB40_ADICA|nr:hypothetical protein GOP47_0017738 [Adiantum capillus-veneris]
MARTKQTAKKSRGGRVSQPSSTRTTSEVLTGPSGVSSSQETNRPSSSVSVNLPRRRRVSQYLGVLRQIRKAQDATTNCIPKAPFVRIVREITEMCKSGTRWMATAVACLQEACEDYLIEYFNDTFILAAHAHRVTIMPKDMTSLSMLRHRYEKFRYMPSFVDKKMKDILLIPPARRPKELKVEEVTEKDIHSRDTRLNQDRIERLKLKQDDHEELKRKPQQLEILQREEKVLKTLNALGPKVEVLMKGDNHVAFVPLEAQDVQILKSFDNDISDTLVMIFLSMIKEELPEDAQDEVFIIDCQISCRLDERKPPQELIAWFTHCNPSIRTIILPYISSRVNILLATIESFHALNIFKEVIHRKIQVPQQKDNHKCGWYLVYNAKAMLDHVYKNETSELSITTYTELDVARFRIKKIESMIDNFNANSWSNCKACSKEKLEFDRREATDDDLSKFFKEMEWFEDEDRLAEESPSQKEEVYKKDPPIDPHVEEFVEDGDIKKSPMPKPSVVSTS